MTQVLALALVSVLALTAETEGATRKQRAAPIRSRAMPNQMAQEQDEFRWCDVRSKILFKEERRPRLFRSKR